nr:MULTISPECIES: hypothetical protein [Pantoea]
MLLLSMVALSGCSMRVADLTVASTKNMNLNSNGFIIGKRVTGIDRVPIIILPIGYPNVKEATDRAIETDKCAVGLTDVVVDENGFYLLFGFDGFNVKGNLIIDKNLPGCENRMPETELLASK